MLLHPLRHGLPLLALGALCCACTSPEEQATAAYTELCTQLHLLQGELSAVQDAASAEQTAPALRERADALRDVLERIDELAESDTLSPEARQRVSEQFHQPLGEAVDAAMQQVIRLGYRSLYHSRALQHLLRREHAHYSAKGVHPWPRAVIKGGKGGKWLNVSSYY